MARNKYPEETVEKILNAANRLFVEKGYENTSIQDIIDQLGGLSKGAIYHHFKSKDDIMLAVIERQFQGMDEAWADTIRDRSGMTGLEKLREMFRISVDNARQDEVFRSAPNMMKSAKMLAAQMESIMTESVPQYIQPVIEQGVADGSIKTDYPQQLAEAILLLVNLWVTPMVFQAPREEIMKRVALFKQILQAFGADFIDADIMRHFVKLYDLYSENG